MNIENILALQEEDGRIRLLQHELKTVLPARRAEAKARLKAAQAAVELATEENLAMQREYDRYQTDYTKQRNTMLRAERNAMGQTRSRSLKAAGAEYEMAKQALARAEAAALRVDESLTPSERRLDAARAFEIEEEQVVTAMLQDLATREDAVKAEMARCTEQRKAAFATLPGELSAHYERVKKTRWPAVAAFDRHASACAGCNIKQPSYVAQKLDAANASDEGAFVCCPNCGRILY